METIEELKREIDGLKSEIGGKVETAQNLMEILEDEMNSNSGINSRHHRVSLGHCRNSRGH